MQQTVCDRCKKVVNPDTMVEIKIITKQHTGPREYNQTVIINDTTFHYCDLCSDCYEKLYTLLSGDYDENTTETK